MTSGPPRSPARRASMAIAATIVTVMAGHVPAADAQSFEYRGFVEVGSQLFPQETPNDRVQTVTDLHVRAEPSVRLAPWARARVGLDARLDTRRYVERAWRVDWRDRRPQRPVLSVRQAQVTLARGPLTIDLGKQFVRWGKTDILTPTDRFAPRDVMEVVDDDFLAVTAGRIQLSSSSTSLDVVYAPRVTASRLPLVDSRWTVLPPDALAADIVARAGPFPTGPQLGARVSHIGNAFEASVSAFSGHNHFRVPTAVVLPPAGSFQRPQLVVSAFFPAIQMAGADLAMPLRWVNVKAEAAFIRSRDAATDDYLLYVVQVERQTGELSMVAGYAGQHITRDRPGQEFAADRGLSEAFIGRLAYTLDAARSVALEAAVRRTGSGIWIRPEYSEAVGAHWRFTVGGHIVRGEANDFIGQFRRSSHLSASLRWSY